MNELIRSGFSEVEVGTVQDPNPPPVAYPPRPPFHHAPLVKSDDQPAQELPPFLLARPAAVTGRTEPDPGGLEKRNTGALGENQ